jgi:hypothetical protein
LLEYLPYRYHEAFEGVSYPRTTISAEIEVYTKDLVDELEESHHPTIQVLQMMVRIVLVLENILTKWLSQ